jgi:hypothetical protein
LKRAGDTCMKGVAADQCGSTEKVPSQPKPPGDVMGRERRRPEDPKRPARIRPLRHAD